MPRQARKISSTQIYHVMLRGNERKNIFKQDEDKDNFREILIKKKQDDKYKLYAYCIMDNPVHLVIKEQKQTLAEAMKSIGISYAYYFNQKYQRVGHLFQDRFKSEAVEKEAYLLSVIRYVHRNPLKAGLTKQLFYPWSSYGRYLDYSYAAADFPEIKDILDIFSEDVAVAQRMFNDFHSKSDDSVFLDIKGEPTNDNEIAAAILQSFLFENKIQREQLGKRGFAEQTRRLLCLLSAQTNLSKRQVAQLVGINRETVRKMLSREPSL